MKKMGLVFLVTISVYWLFGATARSDSRCHAQGTAPFTAPDNGCTPGAFVHKTKADVCDGKTERPRLPSAEERFIERSYGFAVFTGSTGELDHRIPLVFGGTTDRRNIWPEVGSRPNPKDRLEDLLYRRVCTGVPHRMRLSTAIRIFQADWRPAYTRYVQRIGP
jgi:hypothetical protein